MQLETNRFTRALAAKDNQIGLWISRCSNFVACGTDALLLARASDALKAQVKGAVT